MKWLDTNRIKEIIQKVEAGIIKVPITLVPLYSLAKHYLESPQPETVEPERKWSDEHMINFAKYFWCYEEGYETTCPYKQIAIILTEYEQDLDEDFKPTPSPEKQEERHWISEKDFEEDKPDGMQGEKEILDFANNPTGTNYDRMVDSMDESHPTTQPQAGKDRGKEEILERNAKHKFNGSAEENLLKAMQEYADQEVAKVLKYDNNYQLITNLYRELHEEEAEVDKLESQLTQQQSVNSRLVEALEEISKNVNAIPRSSLEDHSIAYELRVMEETSPQRLMNIAFRALQEYKSALSSIPSTIKK